MLRRWIIRGLFMLPVLLGVGGWIRSATYQEYVGFSGGGVWIGCRTQAGSIIPEFGRRSDGTGWLYERGRATSRSMGENIIGGRFEQATTDFTDGWAVGIKLPYWLPVAVFAVLLCGVWRKTRRSRGGPSFPIEATPKG